MTPATPATPATDQAAPSAPPDLLGLARRFDGLDPKADWKERIAIGEQIKARLGLRFEQFETLYDLAAAATDSDRPAEAAVWALDAHLVLGAQDDLARIEARVRLAERACEHAADSLVRPAVLAQLVLALEEIAAARIRPQVPAGAAATAPPADPAEVAAAADRFTEAVASYKAWRTLALQAQVDAEELARASIAWTAARDSFEGEDAARLQLATDQIDQAIAEERRRPSLYPNQLPGSISVP